MSQCVQSQYSVLHLLYTTNAIQRIALIKSITVKQLQVLCEIAFNIYKSKIKNSHYFAKKRLPFKREILTLINRQAGLTKKKVALIKLRSVLQIILKPVLFLIKNGTGINEGVDRGVPHSRFPPPFPPLPSPFSPTSLPLLPHFPPPIRFFPPPDKILFLFKN